MRSLVIVLAVGVMFAAGCKKKTTAATQVSAAGGDPAATVTPGPGGGVVVAGAGGGGGGGAAQAVRKAAQRTEVLNEMNTLGTVIADYDATNGKMPSAAEVTAALQQYPKVLALVNSGDVVLTGSGNRGGVWAYQKDADTQGGIVLVGGRAARMSADEAKQAIAGG